MIPKEVEDMFSAIQTPVIFATAGDKPHATPMNWYYTGDDTFWVSPVGGSRKIKNMLKNKNVCFATLDHMQRNERGFIVWGEIAKMETGFLALLKHFRTMRKALVEKSEMYFDTKTLKLTKTYYKHPDIYYKFAFPWKRYFVKIKMKKIRYWLGDGVEREVDL
ncbi:MAG: pyridoxamine 5'-phosphate oxidase family protein [Candidatus Hydrothermarchaeales archaeon]